MSGYRIRPGREADAAKLAAIEGAAATLFPEEDVPAAMAEEVTPLADFAQAARDEELLVVATADADEPVGFALLEEGEAGIHLEEFDVHPDHARRGLGARLLRAVIELARERECAEVTLTTFRHLPWNAPFYARHGFRAIEADELSSDLAQRLAEEREAGLDPLKRVAMVCPLARD